MCHRVDCVGRSSPVFLSFPFVEPSGFPPWSPGIDENLGIRFPGREGFKRAPDQRDDQPGSNRLLKRGQPDNTANTRDSGRCPRVPRPPKTGEKDRTGPIDHHADAARPKQNKHGWLAWWWWPGWGCVAARGKRACWGAGNSLPLANWSPGQPAPPGAQYPMVEGGKRSAPSSRGGKDCLDCGRQRGGRKWLRLVVVLLIGGGN